MRNNIISKSTKIFLALLFISVTVIAGSIVTKQKANAAENYCADGFYQYADNQLKIYTPATNGFTDIGVRHATGVVNASGYDVNSGLLYSLNGNFNSSKPQQSFLNLIYTDTTNGTVTSLGPLTNANNPSETLNDVMVRALKRATDPGRTNGKSISIGEVNDGIMYVAIGNQENQLPEDKDNDLYVVDLATLTYTKVKTKYKKTIPVEQTRIGPDMVYNAGLLYSVNGRNGPTNFPVLNILNASTGDGSIVNISGLPKAEASYGALWIAKDPVTNNKKFYTYSNDTGAIYEIINIDTNPTAVLRGQGAPLSNNDGAACPNAAPPVFDINAVDDSGVTPLNTPVDVNWKNNDTSGDDSTFSIDSVDPTSVKGGTITDNGDGTFKYTPPLNYYGSDTFEYEICLDDVTPAKCDTATVTITIDAEINAVDDSDVTPLNTPVDVNWKNNDTSGEGSTISIDSVDPTSVKGGTITDNGDGTFKYTPPLNYYGSDTFEYEICLTDVTPAKCDTATVTITITAEINAVDDDMGQTTGQNPVSIPLTTVFGNDTISTGLNFGLCEVGPFTQPANGTVTNVDGEFVYVANEGFSGSDSFTYSICDTVGVLTDTATIQVSVVLPILSVTKTDQDATATRGGDVKYFIESKNTGLGDAEGVVLTETVPEYTTYAGNEGWVCEGDGIAGDTCVFEIGTLKAGATFNITFTVAVDSNVPVVVDSINNVVVLSDRNGNTVNAKDDTPLVEVGGIVVVNPPTTVPVTTPVQVLGTSVTNSALPNTGSNSNGILFMGGMLIASGLVLVKLRKHFDRRLIK